MPQEVLKPGEFRVNGLSTRHPTSFELVPDAEARKALADRLNLSSVKKLRFAGEIAPQGAKGWRMTATLGATIVQPCVVTLEPVTTRIDETVERVYLPAHLLDTVEDGSETEMPEDTTTEPLGSVISAYDAMIESLSLSVPLYPRSDAAELGEAVFAEDGVAPLTDDDVKPFAGLAALRDKLDKNQ